MRTTLGTVEPPLSRRRAENGPTLEDSRIGLGLAALAMLLVTVVVVGAREDVDAAAAGGRAPDPTVTTALASPAARAWANLPWWAVSPRRPIPRLATYRSSRYGYEAQVPDGWTVNPATATAKLDRLRPFPPRSDPETMDVYADGPTQRLWVASAPFAKTADLDAWVAVHLPPRQPRPLRPCRATSGRSRDAWAPIELAVRVARERHDCGDTDVVMVAGSRVYVLAARSAGAHRAPARDREVVAAFLASMAFHPEVATAEPSWPLYEPRTSYASTLYGYAIDAPWDWDVSPGSAAEATDASGAKGIPDRFAGPSDFTIFSTKLPKGVSLADWVEANDLESPRSGGTCRLGWAIVQVPTGAWQQADFDGRPGLVRDGCVIHAVIKVGRRVYVVSYRSSRPDFRVAGLRKVIDRITFRPEGATAP